VIIKKYGDIEGNDSKMTLDAIKRKPRERVQNYFERLDKLFQRGVIQYVEQR
jgi:hypothetical protein